MESKKDHNVSVSRRRSAVSMAPRDNSLARHISLTLIIKVLLLVGLWYLFFSQPIDKLLTDQTVSRALLGGSDTAPTWSLDKDGQ